MQLEEIILIVVFLVAIWIIVARSSRNITYTKVKIGNTTITAEIADNSLKMMKGLKGRSFLAENKGMLFPFNKEGYHKFWMMNMSIPIDMIFMNRKKTVVDILRDAQPSGFSFESYTPKKKAMYILEVKANFTKRHNVKLGSKIYFNLP